MVIYWLAFEKMWKTLKNLRYFSKNWYKYTKDKYILSIITYRLKLYLKVLPTQNSRSTHTLSSKENEIISIEIIKLLKKLVNLFLVFLLGTKKMAIKGWHWICQLQGL